MELFGKIDRDYKGKLKGSYPAYYFKQQIYELEEGIRTTENRLKMDLIPPDSIPRAKADLHADKEKLREIKDSTPKLSQGERDRLWKCYKYLCMVIGESLFTRSQMHLGQADAHEEAKRMVNPCIKLEGDLVSLANECNCKVTKNLLVCRNDAARIFKIIGCLLGESTNIEVLRKDNLTSAIKV